MKPDRPSKTAGKAGYNGQVREPAWIAVDVNGVLASHVEQILPILERRYGLEIGHGEIRSWDFPVGDTSFGAIIRAEQRTPGFVLETPPVPGAVEAMRRLARSHRLAIATGRPPETDLWTRRWLALHEIPYDAYENLQAGMKHRTTMRCDLLIDDYQLNLRSFLENTDGRAILFARPWNWDLSGLEPHLESQRLTVARDWPGILSLVNRPGSALGRSVGDD